jgi:D-xylose transport system substrate-binding protein
LTASNVPRSGGRTFREAFVDQRLRWAGLAAGTALLLALAGCGEAANSGNNSGSGNSGGSNNAANGKIALLLPESKTARYEAADRPYFEAKFKSLCSGCEILYSNADQDSTKQQQQAEAALTKGAKVLVLDPVDGKAAATIVAKAQQQGAKVLSYDRLTQGPVDAYISFDNEQVGKLQGEALLKALGDKATGGNIVWINGDPTDNNATLFKKGAHSVLDGKVTVGKEYDTPQWSPDNAQREMDQAITALGKDSIVGVYAANDGTAGGAIASMKGAGFATIPPVTGQDAELAAIQRIIAGEQYMTIYKAIKPEAELSAQIAFNLLNGKDAFDGLDSGDAPQSTVKNDTKEVPSVLLTPVVVTKDNVKDTVVKDEFHKVAEICTGAYAAACAQLGIS